MCLCLQDETPLFLAAREGSFEAAQVLLDHYSNRDITDHLDRLPRDTAQERMHHDIVRLLDQYNVVHSPHNGPNLMGGNSSVLCGANGGGFIGMRPGPQGKKSRRGGGGGAKVGTGGSAGGGAAKELKDMKAKRRKKPAGGEGAGVSAGVVGASGGGGGATGSANLGKAAAGGGGGTLPESSVTMSPVDSLESPHSYTGDVSAAVASSVPAVATNSPPLLTSPTSRSILPPVGHMLGQQQQQSWVGMSKHGYGGHVFGLLPHQLGGSHPVMGHSHAPMMTPMNVTMSREQLPPIVTFQMMTPGSGNSGASGGQAMIKQPQVSKSQALTQGQGAPGHPQQGAGRLHCPPAMMYPLPEQVGVAHGLPHALQHSHGISHGMEAPPRPLATYPPMQSPVDKYPTPPSHHSYTTTAASSGSEGTTPSHSAHPPSEHPYLTPSPDSPDPWSSSSPLSNSDWSDVTTSPTPLGNPHHPLPSSRHTTHIPEQVQLQSQQMQQPSQQPQPPPPPPPPLGNMQVFA